MSFKYATFRSFPVLLLALALGLPASGQLTSDDCLGCHGDPSAVKDLGNGKTKSVHVDAKAFANSAHGILGCTDCHADVVTYPHEPAPTPVDCGGCHPDMAEQWQNSRHAKAFMAGNRNAAGCLSCHGGNPHAILPKSDPNSPIAHHNVPRTCGNCHSQKLVMESSGLSTFPAFSYRESVHGKAVAGGSEKAAVCIDCHNAHEILGANDPSRRSSGSTSQRRAANATRTWPKST